jgi:hypothetical protein
VHRGLAALFEPEDLFHAELLGGWNQIDCGTTTLGDWCHNNPTPEHTDAALAGLIRSGVRVVFIHGSPKPDPKPGQPHFSEVPHPRAEVERLLTGPLADREGRVTLGLGILGPHYSTLDVSLHDFRLAREFGLLASMHQGGGEAKTPGGWDALEREGLVGEGVNIVHGHRLGDDQTARFSAVLYLRAPMSGSPVSAEAGQLSALVSGPEAAFTAVSPLMATFCHAQTWLGGGEQARFAKLAINLMIAVSAGMMAEALSLARRGDIDWQDMLKLMENSAVGSPMVKYKCALLRERDFTSTFSGRQMAKDLDLILDCARGAGVSVPLAAQMRETYSAIIAAGDGDDDYIATVRHEERLAGLSGVL